MKRQLAIAAALAAMTVPAPAPPPAGAEPASMAAPAVGPAKGVVLVIHGGAWTGVGPSYLPRMRPAAAFFNRRGWATLTIDYTAGWRSIDDVVSFYDRLRAAGRRRRICAYGESAGGHLALLLAVRRRSLDCVISAAGPADLDRLAGSPGADWARGVATQIFGPAPGGEAAYNPIAHAHRIKARVLAGYGRADPIVPASQAAYLRRALPAARTMTLAPGSKPWVHAPISRSSRSRWRRAMRSILAPPVTKLLQAPRNR